MKKFKHYVVQNTYIIRHYDRSYTVNLSQHYQFNLDLDLKIGVINKNRVKLELIFKKPDVMKKILNRFSNKSYKNSQKAQICVQSIDTVIWCYFLENCVLWSYCVGNEAIKIIKIKFQNEMKDYFVCII